MAEILGTENDDSLDTGVGDDTILGLAGTDTLHFGGNLADYVITSAGSFIRITDTNLGDGDDGTDLLQGIEVLSFADVDVDLSLTPDEFQVNTETTGNQRVVSIVGLADGGFLMVWQDDSGQDGDRTGIQAQRYDAAGEPVGGEFQVNTDAFNNQTIPQVTQLAGGNIVFTWSSLGIDGTDRGVAARIFDSTGNPLTGEFTVDLSDTLSGFATAGRSRVEALAGGGFVVVFEDDFEQVDLGFGTTTGGDVFAQRYDAMGDTVGTTVQVNTFTAGRQTMTDVQALADGGFLVAFDDGLTGADGQDGDGTGAYVRRFDAAGAPIEFDAGQLDTLEVRIDTVTQGPQTNGQIAVLSNGGFAIVWRSGAFNMPSGGGENDGSDADVFARIYNADGTVAVGKFRVNEAGEPGIDFGPQLGAAVAGLAGGGFVVVWEDGGGNTELIARRFHNDGTPLGEEFQVNTFDNDTQILSKVAALADGGFVVTWESDDQDGDNRGIFAQRFDAEGNPFGFATVTGSANADTLRGGDEREILDGAAGNDTLDGGAGNDVLYGGTGDDIAIGGDGDDIYIFGNGDGSDSFAGGGGTWTDAIELSGHEGAAAYSDWTLAGATVVESGSDYLVLSENSAGTITMDDGSEITFTGVDRIEW